MRWRAEQVVFEPGGADHASPGGSYDVSSRLSTLVFNNPPPTFLGYEFISLRGGPGKMSSSKGDAISPSDLLQIYEPNLLKWLYSSKRPDQGFGLAFDSEVIRQYDEYDRAIAKQRRGEMNAIEQFSLAAIQDKTSPALPSAPFRQIVGLGQILQWDADRVASALSTAGAVVTADAIKARLLSARNWLETYNPEERIVLLKHPNLDYASKLDGNARRQLAELRTALLNTSRPIAELEKIVYAIPKNVSLGPKENAPLQRTFFKHVYMLLLGKDTGPRLSTFLSALPRQRVLELLDIPD